MPPPSEPPTSCRLCGLPVRGRKDGFCCLGCSHVFEILKEMLGTPDPEAMRGHPFFQQMQTRGIIPSGEGDLARVGMDPVGMRRIPPGEASDGRVFKVTGMWCPSCSWVIERSLLKKAGVVGATASFASDRVKVTYLPRLVGPAEIAEVIRDLGYGIQETDTEQGRERALRKELIRLGVGIFLTVNVMMISFGLYQGFLTELSDAGVRMMGVPIFLMSTVVVFYCGFPVLERAIKAARAGGFVMETLISLGALSAYGLSVYQLFRGSLHMYFDTASMLVTLILLGKYLEARIRYRAILGVEEIYELLPGKARVETEAGERYASIEAVASGDVVRALEQEQIPVDGVILSGEGRVDESKLTGESRLRTTRTGDTVLGAGLLVSGELRIRVTGVGSGSAIGRMIALMEEAMVQKNPAERLTDRIMAVFGPVVILVALATGAALTAMGTPPEEALVRMITVLVIACPCALGIAIPLARVAAIGRARREGILVVNGDALEMACRLTALVIDKTGTATWGIHQMMVVEGVGEHSGADALGLAAAVEAGSDHPVARAIRRHAASAGAEAKGDVQSVELAGLGMRGTVEGEEVLVGNEALLVSEGIDLTRSLKKPPPEGADRGGDGGLCLTGTGGLRHHSARGCASDGHAPGRGRPERRAGSRCISSPATPKGPPGTWPGCWAWTGSREASCPRTRWSGYAVCSVRVTGSAWWATGPTMRPPWPWPTWALPRGKPSPSPSTHPTHDPHRFPDTASFPPWTFRGSRRGPSLQISPWPSSTT